LMSVLKDAAAGPIIGATRTVIREVVGTTDVETRTLYVDSDVFQDEEVKTGPHSATRIVFKDNTVLEMGENSRLKLTKIIFDPDPSKSKLAIKAPVGVFRWASGSLPSSSYQIGTPVSTIGIRGTVIQFSVGETGG